MFRFLMKTILCVLLVLLILAGVLWFGTPDVSLLAQANPVTTSFMEYRREQGGETFTIQHVWVDYAAISRWFILAVIECEDANFFEHAGFDWDAIKNAAGEIIEQRHIVRGGSTITQQLAKNLYLQPTRHVWRKLREALITWRMERELEKERILELYMNIVEMGEGIFGVEAASRHYFNTSAADLDPVEAVCLATILPAPLELSPLERGPRWLHDRRRRVLAYLLEQSDYGVQRRQGFLQRLP